MNNFYYSGQIRRYLNQFIRILSHFQVEFGQDSQGNVTLQQVPVYYGDSSRQAAAIISGNSENVTPTVPAMACYISALDYDRSRLQEPSFVSALQIKERSYDDVTNTWGSNQGNAFTVERLMPAPYKLTLKVDIWTSNTEQKLQLQEQILPLFNPALEIQSTDNYIDWSSLTSIFLVSTNWSSRTIPVGANQENDVTTITFELPIWLNLPAKVKKLGVIQQIVGSIWDANGDLIEGIAGLPNATLLSQRVLSPMNYGVVYYGNTLELYQQDAIIVDTVDGTILEGINLNSWKVLVDTYGTTLQNGTSEVRLEQPNGTVVVGTVSYHPTNSSLLIFNPYPSSLPTNSLLPITAIVDPYTMPASSFINPIIGTRYLILNNIGSSINITNGTSAIAWGNLIAKENDIIEFDGVNWIRSFEATSATTVQYVTNLKSGLQFKWLPESQNWSKAIEGQYLAGQWAIVLSTTV